jgi:hypothetical protein
MHPVKTNLLHSALGKFYSVLQTGCMYASSYFFKQIFCTPVR